jgi:hypothetical protein
MQGFNANGLTSGWNGTLPIGACGPREYVETADERLARDLETKVRIEQARRTLRNMGYSNQEVMTGTTGE